MDARKPVRTLTAIKMMKETSRQVESGHDKVTVVGCGQVGMAAAFSMLTLGVCSDLALCDMRKEAAIGEKMDLLHGLAFLGRHIHIDADNDFAISEVSYSLLFSWRCIVATGFWLASITVQHTFFVRISLFHEHDLRYMVAYNITRDEINNKQPKHVNLFLVILMQFVCAEFSRHHHHGWSSSEGRRDTS